MSLRLPFLCIAIMLVNGSALAQTPTTISGTVLADTNNDNVGDIGINNVTLTLCDGTTSLPVDDPNLAGTQDYVVTTSSNGTYAFNELAPGSYIVKETQPVGYLNVADVDSTADLPTSPPDATNASPADDQIPVNLAAGETDNGNDFTEKPVIISGTVFADTNDDNRGDIGINNVMLTLCDGATSLPVDNPNLSGVQSYVITTGSNGTYAFIGLAPGSYIVKETQPAGYLTIADLDTTVDSGTSPADPTNTSGDDLIAAIVQAGEADSGNDFIEEKPAFAIYRDTVKGTATEQIGRTDPYLGLPANLPAGATAKTTAVPPVTRYWVVGLATGGMTLDVTYGLDSLKQKRYTVSPDVPFPFVITPIKSLTGKVYNSTTAAQWTWKKGSSIADGVADRHNGSIYLLSGKALLRKINASGTESRRLAATLTGSETTIGEAMEDEAPPGHRFHSSTVTSKTMTWTLDDALTKAVNSAAITTLESARDAVLAKLISQGYSATP